MDDRILLDAMWSNTALTRALGASGPGSHLVERDGVLASVVPACPERSVVNGVVYEQAAQLEEAYEELAAAYEAAGVHAWTVWVPGHDHRAGRLLEDRGHVLDAAPEGMGAPLDEVEGPPAEMPPDWSRSPDPGDVGRVNDLAYGYEGSFERALGPLPPEAAHWYAAYEHGRAVSVLMVVDEGDDAEVDFVATVPEARGRGLAGALMTRALADARERGRLTTTLVATALGRPVYERMGYRALGPVQMWERRVTA